MIEILRRRRMAGNNMKSKGTWKQGGGIKPNKGPKPGDGDKGPAVKVASRV